MQFWWERGQEERENDPREWKIKYTGIYAQKCDNEPTYFVY